MSARRWSRLLTGVGGDRGAGRRGPPRSANGASSHHLVWEVPPGAWTTAAATLEVIDAPGVDHLYFWALQVGFDDRGRRGGGAHLGLQWYPPHPGSTAVNWGGYGPDGRELAGSTSTLPSATGNANTRDLPWAPRRRYRLEVSASLRPAPDGGPAWQGTVTDEADGRRWVVRDLYAQGAALTGLMVWSEVFADCDAPPTKVAWSELAVGLGDGTWRPVRRVRTSYQRVGDGGCTASDSSVEGGRFVQATGVARRTPAGAVLDLGEGSDAGGQPSRS